MLQIHDLVVEIIAIRSCGIWIITEKIEDQDVTNRGLDGHHYT